MTSSTPVQIQDAQDEHRQQLEELVAKQGTILYKELLEPEDYATWLYNATSEESFRKNLSEGLVLIALQGDEVVGTITISYAAINWSTIHKADFIVKGMYAKYTGQGVGAALLQAALERVENNGKTKGILSVALHNDAAKRFYERYGFREASCHYFHSGRRWNTLTLDLPAV